MTRRPVSVVSYKNTFYHRSVPATVSRRREPVRQLLVWYDLVMRHSCCECHCAHCFHIGTTYARALLSDEGLSRLKLLKAPKRASSLNWNTYKCPSGCSKDRNRRGIIGVRENITQYKAGSRQVHSYWDWLGWRLQGLMMYLQRRAFPHNLIYRMKGHDYRANRT